jgi:hypothetical protein
MDLHDFPTEDNPLVIDGDYYVRSILVCDGQPVDAQERRVYLWIDVGERAMGNSPVLTYCQPECVPGIQYPHENEKRESFFLGELFNVAPIFLRDWGIET